MSDARSMSTDLVNERTNGPGESRIYSTYTIGPEHAGLTVEEYLRQVAGCSSRTFQKLTHSKGIHLNNRPAYSNKKLRAGDRLKAAVPSDTSFGVELENAPVEILHEDDRVIVLNKRAGILVHPAGHTTTGTLANHLAYEFCRRGIVCTVRPVHRLDRDTSGCVIFAKDAKTQTALEGQMREGTLARTYWALVRGVPEPAEGIADFPIGPHATMPNRRAITPKGERAVTRYRTLERLADASLLELQLETGRTHQIRVHLAHLGHPVVGDRMYGTKSLRIDRQALHAESVTYNDPTTGEAVTVHAPLPADFAGAMEGLVK